MTRAAEDVAAAAAGAPVELGLPGGRWDSLIREALARGDTEAQRFFVLADVVDRASRWLGIERMLEGKAEDSVFASALYAFLDEERARRAAELLVRPDMGAFELEVDRLSGFVDGSVERQRDMLGAFAFLRDRLDIKSDVTQEEHDRLKAQLAAALGGYVQRLGGLFLGGYYPWLRAIAKWAEDRKLAVL